MIYHIYWGTTGNSGLYLDAIYKVLEQGGYNQKVFVNYYYPFDYGEKIFFKYGDIGHSKFSGAARKIIQLIEVLRGFSIILFYSIKEKPELINYSHAGNSFFFIPAYLYCLKIISKAKLVVTCHDVMPHYDIPSEEKNRRKIFQLADNLIVHTNSSVYELVNNFGINRKRIVKHLFPIMDLSLLTKYKGKSFPKTDFIFIGHLRKDKGIEFLLDSWRKFHEICPEATIRLCGKKEPTLCLNVDEFNGCNMEFNLHFISDEDYYGYVKSSRCVLLPYLQGTNSGIISTVQSLGADIITSDIPMFKENTLVSEDDTFEVGNMNSFINIMLKKYKSKEKKDYNKLEQYKNDFRNEVLNVYRMLLRNK